MKQSRVVGAIILFFLLPAGRGVFCAADDVIDVGGRRELFVDDYLVDKLEGSARLKVCHPVRREIAIVHNEAWEGSGSGYHTIFKDGDKYRMYYKSWDLGPRGGGQRPIFIAYAESKDGVNWVKPNLGLVEFEGSKENNIILGEIGEYGCHDFTVFIDGNPAAGEEERYKAVAYTQGLTGRRGLFGFVSSDGIRWERIKEGFIFTDSGKVFDTQNNAFWSELEGRYVLYYRKWVDGIRHIGRAVSNDFVNWEKEGVIDIGGGGPTKREQFYTNQIRPYFRAPHIYIGFPARYVDRGWIKSTVALPGLAERRERLRGSRRYGSAVTDSVLISSRDGQHFSRREEAFLRPGLRTRHNWAYGDNYIACHAVETASQFDDEPNELSLYATEGYFTGSWSRLRRYTLRLDGFGSIHAGRSAGAVVTRPIRFEGSELHINFSTSAAGSVRVEIQRADGEIVSGYSLRECLEIFGDSLDYAVCWEAGEDLSKLAGKKIRLRFVLCEADVYAFEFVGGD